jgi:uncharacterized protein HemY
VPYSWSTRKYFKSPTLDQKRLLQFRQKLEQLTNMNPDNPALLFQLGTLCMQMDQAACAIALLHRSMKAGKDGTGRQGAPSMAEHGGGLQGRASR